MPYLQLFVPQGKSESEARDLLNYLRDNFPLKQSEGRVLRVASNFILFEQPEHSRLTLEQEVWLEKHGGENFVSVQYDILANSICDVCKSPIEDSPTGYCPRCYATDPQLVTHLTLHFQPDEYPYVQIQNQYIWGGVDGPCLRIYVRAFLYLLEQGQLTLEDVSHASFEQFKTAARTYTHQARTTCYYCGLSKEQCKCKYPHFLQLPNLEVCKENVPISEEEFRELRVFAEQRGMDVETFALCGLTMLQVQLAAASREAALGRIFNCLMDFLLKEPGMKARLGTEVIGTESLNFSFFHIVRTCLSLIYTVPMLGTSLFELLLGLHHEALNGQYLTRPKEQLALIDTVAAQSTIPCTPGEIEALEQKISYKLPAAYKEFLAWMGYGAGSFLRCLDCFYPSLISLQQEARTMLAADVCSSTLAEEAFVFVLIPGEGFAYVLASEGDDPSVYAHRRVWRNAPFRKIYHRFSDLITVQLALYADLRQPKIFQDVYGSESRRRSQEMSIKVQAALAQQLD